MSDATPTARVSRITMARLYSLGNYNHMRYEVTVDVPEGADAADAARRLKAILWDLRPVKVDQHHLKRSRDLLACMAAQGEPPAGHFYVDVDAAVAEAQRYVAAHEAGRARIEKAMAAFKDLGGSDTYTDAKLDWEEEED